MNDTLQLSDLRFEKRLREVSDLSYLDSIAELGVLEPLVVERRGDGSHWLLAGAHRRQWLLDHGFTTLYHGTTCDPDKPGFVWSKELTPARRREVELEENLGRKPMTWQERCLSISEIHKIRSLEAHLEGDDWGHKQTAKLLGQGYSEYNVNYAVLISKALSAGDEELAKAPGFTAAIDILLERKQREAEKHAQALVAAAQKPLVLAPSGPKLDSLIEEPVVSVPLSESLIHMDCLGYLAGLPEGSFDHCLTDPPYAIDMEPLVNKTLNTVVEEHKVNENLSLLQDFVPEAYRILKDKGFLVMWCDQEIWPTLHMFARNEGFSVCDWPFTWAKTHPCSNQQAQANFTKATEIAMICRKGRATLRFPQARNWWAGTFAPGEREQFEHPFVKPKALWDILLQAIVEPGQHLLEPFAGEGSGVLSSLAYGAKVTAVEKSAHHFPLLTNNIQNFYKRKFGPQTQFT